MSARPDWVSPPDPQQHLDDTVDAFVEATGSRPEGVWAAPGRVNLVGEHVDYNGGPVLPMAIGHRGLVAVRRRDDGRVRLRSRQDDAVWDGDLTDLSPGGTASGWVAYAGGVLWALREAGHDVPGVDLLVDGRVPVGSGLSSSASLTCSVAVALADLLGLPGADADDDHGRRALAEACVRAENDFAGAPTGGMDQAVVLRARAGHALLLDCSTFDAEHIPFPLEGSGPGSSDLALLVVDTRAHHELVDGQYGSRREACEQAARALGVDRLADVPPAGLDDALGRLADAAGPHQASELQRCVRHVVTEVGRVHRVVELLRAGRLGELGEDLLASHASLRDDYRVSAPELDLVVDSATAAGALGARMTGGGFGGSAIALCPAGALDEVAAAVAQAFDDAGHGAPGFLPFAPSGAAGRVL